MKVDCSDYPNPFAQAPLPPASSPKQHHISLNLKKKFLKLQFCNLYCHEKILKDVILYQKITINFTEVFYNFKLDLVVVSGQLKKFVEFSK